MSKHKFIIGDVTSALKTMPDKSVHVCVTSPPYYGLRQYKTNHILFGGDPNCEHIWQDVHPPGYRKSDTKPGKLQHEGNKHREGLTSNTCKKCGAWKGELGLEPTPQMYVAHLVEIFRDVKRVLRDDGIIFLNLGDGYATGKGTMYNPGGGKNSLGKDAKEAGAHPLNKGNISDLKQCGLKPKDLLGIPWRVAFALQDDGWYLRNDNIWCLSGTTRVYVKSQKREMPMMIKDMARLDKKTLKMWNGEKWVGVINIENVGKHKNGLRLLLRSGERIVTTPEHQWITERGLVRSADLKPEDILKSCTLPEPDNPVKPDMLPEEDVGWFVGMYLAEGSRSGGIKDKNSRDRIQISTHADENGRFERLAKICKLYGCRPVWHKHMKSNSPKASTINISSKILSAILDTYIEGNTAKFKHLSIKCWERSNLFLSSLLQGYLEGDGHYEKNNDRWRLGFTNNYFLEKDLRVLSARLGLTLTLKACRSRFGERYFPSMRGEIRFAKTTHLNSKSRGEIISIEPTEENTFYSIEAEEPNIFALASGILTHNSKKNCMPFPAVDRFVNTHEYVFLLSKSQRYYFDWFAVSEPVKITTIQRATRGRGSPTNKYQNVIDGEFGQSKQGIHSNITPHSKEKIPARFGIKDEEFDGIAFGGKKYPDEIGGIYSGCGYELKSRRRKRDVWRFATASCRESHYAVFPRDIPEIAINAGTSEHGCCPKCGAAYIRQLSKNEAEEEWKKACGADENGEYHGEALKDYEEHGCQDPSDLKRRILEGMKQITTTGWKPGCKCGSAYTVPCTVLDIFMGSGTTAEVAKDMNRDSIGIDLDPANILIQKKRMGFVDGQNRLVEDCEWIMLE